MAGEASGMPSVVNDLMDQVQVKRRSPLEQRKQQSLIQCQGIQAEKSGHDHPCHHPKILPTEHSHLKHDHLLVMAAHLHPAPPHPVVAIHTAGPRHPDISCLGVISATAIPPLPAWAGYEIRVENR